MRVNVEASRDGKALRDEGRLSPQEKEVRDGNQGRSVLAVAQLDIHARFVDVFVELIGAAGGPSFSVIHTYLASSS